MKKASKSFSSLPHLAPQTVKSSQEFEEMICLMGGRPPQPPEAYRVLEQQGEGRTVDVCGNCRINCCADFVIPLTVVDAQRLRTGLMLDWSAFATLTDYHSDNPNWPIRLKNRKAQLSLKRRRGGCLFLLNLGGQRRCGGHALRPIACRMFPFVANRVAQSRAYPGMQTQLPPSRCPWAWPADEAAKREVLDLITEDELAREIDQSVLRTWSRQMNLPHTKENFFLFLQQEMDRRDKGENGPSPWRTALW